MAKHGGPAPDWKIVWWPKKCLRALLHLNPPIFFKWNIFIFFKIIFLGNAFLGKYIFMKYIVHRRTYTPPPGNWAHSRKVAAVAMGLVRPCSGQCTGMARGGHDVRPDVPRLLLNRELVGQRAGRGRPGFRFEAADNERDVATVRWSEATSCRWSPRAAFLFALFRSSAMDVLLAAWWGAFLAWSLIDKLSKREEKNYAYGWMWHSAPYFFMMIFLHMEYHVDDDTLMIMLSLW